MANNIIEHFRGEESTTEHFDVASENPRVAKCFFLLKNLLAKTINLQFVSFHQLLKMDFELDI